jgi:hypothetical protein
VRFFHDRSVHGTTLPLDHSDSVLCATVQRVGKLRAPSWSCIPTLLLHQCTLRPTTAAEADAAARVLSCHVSGLPRRRAVGRCPTVLVRSDSTHVLSAHPRSHPRRLISPLEDSIQYHLQLFQLPSPSTSHHILIMADLISPSTNYLLSI